jgi:hypothetical protein
MGHTHTIIQLLHSRNSFLENIISLSNPNIHLILYKKTKKVFIILKIDF